MVWVAVAASTVIAALAYIHFRSPKTRLPVERPVKGIYKHLTDGVAEDFTISKPNTSKKPTESETPPTIHLDDTEQSTSNKSRPSPQRTHTAPSIGLLQPSDPQPLPSQSMPPPARPRSSSPPRLAPPTMSAPPRPGNGFIKPPLSAAASLRVPQTKVLSTASLAPSAPGVRKNSSKQITLKPGYSPLDWAALTNDPNSNLRGKDAPRDLVKITPTQLKKQTGRKNKDAWTSFQGKVYNISAYLPFHPGGEAEIMKGAGRDSGKLFMENHPWVNWDGMLAECLVGVLVSETELNTKLHNSGGLDDMD